ncbi:hypothetical protein Tco_1176041 [Tanacetum coccineum]
MGPRQRTELLPPNIANPLYGAAMEKLLMSSYMTKNPILSYLHVFGALCYPTNDSENLGKIQAKADIDSVASLVPVVEAPAAVELIGSPSSTLVDQDAPSSSTLQTTQQSQSESIPLGAKEESHDLEVAHINAPISEHLSKWTKDHPLQNIIGDPYRPVSTRLQLHEQALFFYYDAFLTSVEPKTYKDALTQSCWIKAMQEELNEFELL